MPLILPPVYQNPLAYPAGRAPGLDPTHPLAAGIGPSRGFSAIAMGGGFCSIHTGTPWTMTGAPVASTDAIIGPYSNLDVTGKQFQISGQASFTPSAVTFAVIIILNATGITEAYMNDGANFSFGAAAGSFILFAGVLKTFSGFTPATGVPYFYGASINAGTTNFIVTNLLTGTIATGSTSGAAPAGGVVWRLSNSAVNPANAKISHAAVSYVFTSMAQLLQIAADPWSFWYPDPGDNWIGQYPVISSGGLGALLSDRRSMIIGGGLTL